MRQIRGLTGLVLALAGTVGATTAQAERLTMGATYSSSPYYAYQVGMAGFLAKTVDDLQVNVRELGGGQVSTEALLRGEVDMSIAVSATDFSAMAGEKPFGAPAEELRTLWYFAPTWLNFVVAADSGIASMRDLSGRHINPGGRGSSTESMVDLVLAELGIEPELVRIDGTDALEEFQNGRLDGFVKSGLLPDAYIQQAAVARDISFVPMTDEEIDKIIAAYPYFSRADVKTEDAEFSTVQTAVGITTTSDMSEEMAYQIAKAVFSEEGKTAAAEVYPPSKAFSAAEVTLVAAVAPLHPGVLRYFDEQGIEVPERLKAAATQ